MNTSKPGIDQQSAASDERTSDLLDVKRSWPQPEELGVPTDCEIELIVKNASPTAQRVFKDAVRSLYWAKWRSADKTPWRQLIDTHGQADLIRIELEVADHHGRPRKQIVFSERGFLLKGHDALLFNAVAELSKAFDLLIAERQTKTEVSMRALDARHGPVRRFKEWAVANARSSSKQEARRLIRTMPDEVKELAKDLEDPERVVYDAIRRAQKSV